MKIGFFLYKNTDILDPEQEQICVYVHFCVFSYSPLSFMFLSKSSIIYPNKIGP